MQLRIRGVWGYRGLGLEVQGYIQVVRFGAMLRFRVQA